LAFDLKCIFCKIVQKQASASLVYEDDSIMAFLDIRPLSLGHTLVIPKTHYVDIFDIPPEKLCEVNSAVQHIACAVKKATGADGISIIQQNGKAAGQDIFHLHVHIVPRYSGQALPKFSDLELAERSTLDEMAKKIRSYL
jgi:histidine triad (HIT) family protein